MNEEIVSHYWACHAERHYMENKVLANHSSCYSFRTISKVVVLDIMTAQEVALLCILNVEYSRSR